MRTALTGLVLAFTCATLVVSIGAAQAVQVPDQPIVDSTAGLPRSQTFSVFGAGGNSVFAEQSFGPAFTIDRPTLVTEIGAFANNCRTIIAAVPLCPSTRPFIVEVRPDAGGLPNSEVVLASVELSHDDDPLHVRYESAQPNLVLRPGRYFAMFTAQGEDAGFVLGTASDPFPYLADEVVTGDHNGERWLTSRHHAAFVILGRPIGDPADVLVTGTTLQLADGDMIVFDEAGRGHRLRGDATTVLHLKLLAGNTVTVVGTPLRDPLAVPNYPIHVRDFRVEPDGAFDGQDVSVVGPSARLPDGDVIVYDVHGRGHRLRGSGAIGVEIDRLAGKRLHVTGRASVTNVAAHLTWPIDVTSILEAT